MLQLCNSSSCLRLTIPFQMRNHLSHTALNLNANPSIGAFPLSLHSNKMPLHILARSFLPCPPLVLSTVDPLTSAHFTYLFLIARILWKVDFSILAGIFLSLDRSPPPLPTPACGLANRLPISLVAGPSVPPYPLPPP